MAGQKQASRSAQSAGGRNWKPAEARRGGLAGYLAEHKLETAIWLFSLIGLGISIYLTIEHYTQNAYAGCPTNSTFNCFKVTTSPESVILGIPVAVLGLAFYLFLSAINSPWGWRSKLPAVHWVRVGSIVLGMVFVLYLVYAELFLINSICLYCTAVHIITFILFGLIVTRATISGITPERSHSQRGVPTA